MRRLLLVLVLAIGGLVAGTSTGSAHDILESSDPADGSSLALAPTELRLTFSGAPQLRFTTVTVTGPDGRKYEVGDIRESGTTLTVPLGPLGPAGQYTVGYRILSSDSHPMSGAVRFDLTAPDPLAESGTVAVQSTPEGTASQLDTAVENDSEEADSGNGDDDGAPVWPWIVLAVGLLAAGVVFALRVDRRN